MEKKNLHLSPSVPTQKLFPPLFSPGPSQRGGLRVTEPRNGFATGGGLGDEAEGGGGGKMMLVINIVTPEEDFHGVRAVSTTSRGTSLKFVYVSIPYNNSYRSANGLLQPLDTFSCNFHFSPPRPPQTRPFPKTNPVFSFQLNPGFSNYPVGQYKSSLSRKSQGEILAPVHISLKSILQLSPPLPPTPPINPPHNSNKYFPPKKRK